MAVNWAVDVIDSDLGHSTVREASSIEFNWLISEDRAKSGAHASEYRSVSSIKSHWVESSELRSFKDKLGRARVGCVIIIDRFNSMKANFANSARSRDSTLESVNVKGRLDILEVMRVPTLMNTLVDRPKVSEVDTVVRSLEDKVSNVWSLVVQVVDEEFGLIKDSNMVVFVLDLDITIRRS